jgi:hypothetical protein
MARYDEMTESNWLTKKEKLIQKSTTIFVFICLIDFILLIFRPVRYYHFDNFPNMHFIGIILLFTMVLIRILQAEKEGKDPYMEASLEWRKRKDMLGPYDFVGPGSDYSNKTHNIVYYLGVFVSICLIIIEMINYFG